LKFLFCDLETTGTDPRANGIIEMGMIIKTPRACEEHAFRIKPFPSDKINPKALEVNRIKEEDLAGYADPKEFHRKLTTIFSTYINKYDREDKFIFVAYNANFDYNFLRAFFNKCGDKYFGSYVHFPPYDVMQLCLHHLLDCRYKMPNFKLITVAHECGIGMDESLAHGALYDIQKTEELFWKYNPHLKGGVK